LYVTSNETWPLASDESEQVDTRQAEMRMIKWMCGIKITDRFSSCKLRERLGTDDIIGDTATYVKMVWACFKKG